MVKSLLVHFKNTQNQGFWLGAFGISGWAWCLCLPFLVGVLRGKWRWEDYRVGGKLVTPGWWFFGLVHLLTVFGSLVSDKWVLQHEEFGLHEPGKETNLSLTKTSHMAISCLCLFQAIELFLSITDVCSVVLTAPVLLRRNSVGHHIQLLIVATVTMAFASTQLLGP